jgi:hypothetical protein
MIVSEDEFDCLNMIYLKKRLRHPRSCDPPTEIPGSPRSRSIIGPVGRNAVTPTRESVPIPAKSGREDSRLTCGELRQAIDPVVANEEEVEVDQPEQE